MQRKRIFILGSTGSIGINTLKVIERFPDRFQVVGLTAYNNFKLLETQMRKFRPKYVASGQTNRAYLQKGSRLKNIFDAEQDLEFLASREDVDMVVIAIKGSAALKPFLAAIRKGKTVATANKEALVVAGEIIMKEAAKHHASIIPIDSEQSAIFQCLEGNKRHELKCVHLTASGGPLLNMKQNMFSRLTVHDILRHPRWKMGKKITVDSATLMNKGFEVIEAKHLFNLDIKDIKVLVHPEAIIHSMIEFKDGSILAQLAITDMRLPIQYALTHPTRLETGLSRLDFAQLKQFTFFKPDMRKFPSLQLAIYAAEKGGTLPCVLNAADEIVVEAFLEGKISFVQIFHLVEKVVSKHKINRQLTLNNIMEADEWAREEARQLIYN
jgi:1-deoxy-D-xylulose-5-phosphate reductoisomerase